MANARRQISERSSYEHTHDGIQVERGGQGLRITRSWSRGAGYAMLAWTVVWFGLVAFFLSLSHQSGGWFELLALLPGMAMAYAAMTRFFNHTLIEADRSRLVVRHEPLPWPGGKRFARRDVRGLHVEVRRIHAKGNSVDERWIFIVRPDGRKATLVKGLEMSELQMNSIVAALSEYLGVTVTAGRD